MKNTLRHIAQCVATTMLVLVVLTACERKPLYIEPQGNVMVESSICEINLNLLWGAHWEAEWQYDWDETLWGPLGYTTPTGVRATIYELENQQRNIFSVTNFAVEGGRVSLRGGSWYDMLFHNNGTEYILFKSGEANSSYYCTTRSSTKTPLTRSVGDYVDYNAPDQLFGVFMENLEVSDDPSDYDRYVDENGTTIYMYRVDASLQPHTFIYLIQVMVLNNTTSTGATKVKGCFGATVAGLAEEVNLFTRINSSSAISVTSDDVKPMQFNRNLVLPDGTEAVGDIVATRLLTWGLPGIDPLQAAKERSASTTGPNYVGIGLNLSNGATYTLMKDITAQMQQHPAGGVITVVIDAQQDVPDVTPTPPNTGGGFNPTVDDWENEVNVDLVI